MFAELDVLYIIGAHLNLLNPLKLPAKKFI